MNIHDEIMCPTRPDLIKTIENTVKETVASFRPTVPLLEIDWSSEMVTWADK
jgi:hypothetical protein